MASSELREQFPQFGHVWKCAVLLQKLAHTEGWVSFGFLFKNLRAYSTMAIVLSVEWSSIYFQAQKPRVAWLYTVAVPHWSHRKSSLKEHHLFLEGEGCLSYKTEKAKPQKCCGWGFISGVHKNILFLFVCVCALVHTYLDEYVFYKIKASDSLELELQVLGPEPQSSR